MEISCLCFLFSGEEFSKRSPLGFLVYKDILNPKISVKIQLFNLIEFSELDVTP